MQRLKDSHILKRMASNFYKKAENYKKIEKIGYEVDGIDEVIVLRSEFKSFIIRDNKDIKLIEEAKIEVISPVLKEGNYKWKGLYDKEKIDFSMGDFSFKTDIINQKYNFYNGTSIVCQLEIHKTFDDFGNETKRSYSVKKVCRVELDDDIKITKSGIKRNKKFKRIISQVYLMIMRRKNKNGKKTFIKKYLYTRFTYIRILE